MVKVDCLTLPTGAKLPLLGLGTWLAKDEEQLHTAVKAAIDAGYRLFDTAFLYETEAGVGNALNDCIQSGKVKREELFITTKLPFTAHCPSDVEDVVAQQLKTLKVDYIDLYLIHCPCATKAQKLMAHELSYEDDQLHRLSKIREIYSFHKTGSFAPLVENGSFAVDNVDHLDTWRALEKLFKQGKLKAIGLSNFNEEQIQRIYDHADIKPHNLQVEAHLYFPQKELQEFCKLRNITMTAYAPLGSPGRKVFRPNGFWPEGEPLKDPVVSVIASKHKKTPAQILLKYLVQRGICAVPKSTNVEHIRENVDIFDFLLDSDDFIELDRIEHRVRLFIFDYFGHHPCYPMKDQDTTKFEKVVFESF